MAGLGLGQLGRRTQLEDALGAVEQQLRRTEGAAQQLRHRLVALDLAQPPLRAPRRLARQAARRRPRGGERRGRRAVCRRCRAGRGGGDGGGRVVGVVGVVGARAGGEAVGALRRGHELVRAERQDVGVADGSYAKPSEHLRDERGRRGKGEEVMEDGWSLGRL